MDIIEELRLRDELLEFESEFGCGYIHKDHRWVLCLIYIAQQQNLLPEPCKIVYFDAHHDSKKPYCMDKIKSIRAEGITSGDLFKLCDSALSRTDDDWLIAGMELGLISNSIGIGVRQRGGNKRHRVFKDHKGNEHSIWLIGPLLSAFGYQGCLSDLAKINVFRNLWDSLHWKKDKNRPFAFERNDEIFLLDFDLDCFAINWDDYTFPWPDEIFAKEYTTSSDYSSTRGWTGSEFIKTLAKSAGLITICTEPSFCGGKLNVRRIASKFNEFIFNNSLQFPEFPT